ncbi:MAG: Asparagine synthetase [Acidobacteria bacterium]|nr:Asparagine synthetase [Acidobacteriota bacterium]
MCGILGLSFIGRREDAIEAVQRGLSTIIHRGPDDSGLIAIAGAGDNQQVVFGHQRLSIIDLSIAGHQPMLDPLTGNWISYNGEVYNFKELRRELEGHGCAFRSNSDTEVLLHSYRVWGRECVKRWRGMFALAIWDEQRKELFLARDRLGIKPLYYCVTSIPTVMGGSNTTSHGQDARATFIFASELRAILATGLIEPRLNITGLDTFLMFGAVQDPLTIIDGIKSLPAAHTLTVKPNGAIELHEYWDVADKRDTGILPVIGVDDDSTPHARDARATLRDTLSDAVRLRLISDVPHGVFLSGGIDSSAIAMLAQVGSEDPVKTFTIGFEETSFDEGAQAKETARQLGVEHHPILLTEAGMLASYQEAIGALDQPSIDGVNTFHVSRAVKQAGMTVALSGLGGDEVFCGYEHFRTIPRREHLLEKWSQAPFLLRRFASALVPGNGSDRNVKLRALILSEYGFPHPYFLSRTLFLPNQIAGLLDPDAVAGIDYGDWGKRMKTIVNRSLSFDPLSRLSYLELKTYIANTLLRDTDVMSMAHSLEVRVPLLDHVLVEQVLRIPGTQKFDGKTAKPLLVSSLPQSLPERVTSGPKRGFVLPYQKWLSGSLRKQVEASLADQPKALSGIIQTKAVDAVWQSFLEGRTSWTRPWSLFVLYEVTRRIFASSEVNRSNLKAVGVEQRDSESGFTSVEPTVYSLR